MGRFSRLRNFLARHTSRVSPAPLEQVRKQADQVIVDKVTPYNLWSEIIEKKNVALAIVVGSMAIAIGMIVSAAIHG